VVAFFHLSGHASGAYGECWLEDNLGASTTEVEDGRRGCFVGATNLSKKVVGCDPGVDTFLLAGHDNHTVMFAGDDGEWVVGLEMVADRFEDGRRLLFAQQTKPGCSFDCERRA
jgi:hypothetical protein